jgi:hypothetical protein
MNQTLFSTHPNAVLSTDKGVELEAANTDAQLSFGAESTSPQLSSTGHPSL